MRTLWLPDVLRGAGVPVVCHPGWEQRGKELVGVDGVIGHHTASARGSGNAPSLGICVNGRPDLPGPLCTAVLARDGTWIVIASGVGNHAGSGAWPGFRGGNRYTIGVEAENAGTGLEPWPQVQLDSYAAGVAAILRHLGLDETRFCSHYEWARPAGRKVDPRGPWVGGGDWWSGRLTVGERNAGMFRSKVNALLGGGDDDMTPEEHALLVQASTDAAYCRHILDNVVRPKLDAVYIDVHAQDHPELLAGMVRELVDRP